MRILHATTVDKRGIKHVNVMPRRVKQISKKRSCGAVTAKAPHIKTVTVDDKRRPMLNMQQILKSTVLHSKLMTGMFKG